MGNHLALHSDAQAPATGEANSATAWHDAFSRTETTYDVFRNLRRFAALYGYQFFIVLNEPAGAGARLAEILIINNWDPELVRAYDGLDLHDSGPVARWMSDAVEPLCWNLEDIIRGAAGRRQREAVGLLKGAGHLSGVFIPVHAADSSKGVLGFSGWRTRPLSDRQVMEIAWVSGAAYNRLKRIEQPPAAHRAILTEREIECIGWIAAGKSSAETATILGLSPHTVDHYLSTAGHKLDTVNRAHTVATALRMRLLR